jgi:galactose-1-phosphate uridylyltransferase
MDGVGAHEVIIESPRHDQTIGTLPCSQLELVLNCYRERFCALLEDPRIELVTIFRNHGEQAGTSLIHPHSQLISTPAGFELGSGIYISTAYPEQSAGFLRGVVLPPELPPQAV